MSRLETESCHKIQNLKQEGRLPDCNSDRATSLPTTTTSPFHPGTFDRSESYKDSNGNESEIGLWAAFPAIDWNTVEGYKDPSMSSFAVDFEDSESGTELEVISLLKMTELSKMTSLSIQTRLAGPAATSSEKYEQGSLELLAQR